MEKKLYHEKMDQDLKKETDEGEENREIFRENYNQEYKVMDITIDELVTKAK